MLAITNIISSIDTNDFPSNSPNIFSLPKEIFLSIIENLSILDVSRLAHTCKHFYDFITTRKLKCMLSHDAGWELHHSFYKSHNIAFKIILNDSFIRWKKALEESVGRASSKNQKEAIQFLINWKGPNSEWIDPRSNCNGSVRFASEKGHKEIVEILLAWRGPNKEWVDPRDSEPDDFLWYRSYKEYSLRKACINGHKDVVEILLKWRGPEGEWVDPRAKSNEAILEASERGYQEIVKLLLTWRGPNHEYIDIRFLFNLVYYSIHYEDTVLLEILLKWEGVNGFITRLNLTYGENLPIRFACKKGNVEIVKLLLNWRGQFSWLTVDPTANDNEAILNAIYYGHLEVVKLLLDWRGPKGQWINPREAFSIAKKEGNQEIIDLFLKWIGPNGEKIES